MRAFARIGFPPHSNGEVSSSHDDGGVMSPGLAAPDPSAADYRATSPETGEVGL